MTKTEDILFTLCKPYLLDLARLLIDSLEHPDEPYHELAEGKKYKFPSDITGRFNSLTQGQKILLLTEICDWFMSAEGKALTESDHPNTQ